METLISKISRTAEEKPDVMALAFKSEIVTYRQLFERVRYVAGSLFQKGIKKGGRVVFSALSKPEMIYVYLGIQYIGAAAVFADKNGTPESIYRICEDVEAACLITDKPMKEYAEKLSVISMRELCAERPDHIPDYCNPGEDDLAELIYTTGTTGTPKGVMLTYRAVYYIFTYTITGIGIKADDIILLPLPLHHSFALRVLRAALYAGAAVVLQNGFTFAKEIENNMNAYHCTGMASVAASLETIKMQMQDKISGILGGLRFIEVSASALPVSRRKEFVNLLPNTVIHNTWGSSESGGAVFLNVTETIKYHPEKADALGKPAAGIEVAVLDTNGKPMKSDREHPGRMALKGGMVMSGYWNRNELTKKTLCDGWLLTGDMAYIDDDGYVYMLGRADDMINVGGEKVSPVEVENTAGEYDGIRECACIGVSDPEGVTGQMPVLFAVSSAAGFEPKELQKYLALRLERYKIPKEYILLEKLPRNSMNKVDRKALRQIWENRDALHFMNPVMQAILSRRSIRKFRDEPIPDAVLEMILKAGYHAPSGHNMQSWRFTVLRSEGMIKNLKDAAEEAAKENGVYFYGWENPKAVILISNDDRNPYGCQDASAAAENIFLAAWSYGIGSVWLNPLMKLRNVSPVKEILDGYGIPENHMVWCTAALGYPMADSVLLAKNPDVIRFIK